jgi:hypothetical protein
MKLQFAIGAFLVLLGAVELWDWLKERELPFPMVVLGGVVLALVSNYKRLPIETMLARLSSALTEDSDAE